MVSAWLLPYALGFGITLMVARTRFLAGVEKPGIDTHARAWAVAVFLALAWPGIIWNIAFFAVLKAATTREPL